MKRLILFVAFMGLTFGETVFSQIDKQLIANIVREANENSQLEPLAHEMLDVIGPRLVGTPQMKHAGDWAIAKNAQWGIPAENEEWGEWRGWDRGITHIDMVHPRVLSLKGTQLAWSPGTGKKGVTGELLVLPTVANAAEFNKWLPNVKGKMVMINMKEMTGRPDYNWEEFATGESFDKMKKERKLQQDEWSENMERIGLNRSSLSIALEEAGAVGIVTSYWSRGFGANKIFSGATKKIPTVDLQLEDYSMLYRLEESGNRPQIKIVAESKELGTVPTFNTIATIKGSEKREEHGILRSHLDAGGGCTAATDNGSDAVVLNEAMRMHKEIYAKPKRTRLVGNWGSGEQGLNGSSAFLEDHPEIVKDIQSVSTQDN